MRKYDKIRRMKKAGGSLMLLLTALIWGMAFVVQRSGMSYLGPYTFQSVRTLLASAVLLPMALMSKNITGILPSSHGVQIRWG